MPHGTHRLWRAGGINISEHGFAPSPSKQLLPLSMAASISLLVWLALATTRIRAQVVQPAVVVAATDELADAVGLGADHIVITEHLDLGSTVLEMAPGLRSLRVRTGARSSLCR